MNQRQRPTVAFHTLGCKVNQHDSDVMAALFQDAGYDIVAFDEVADVYIINTCTVTHLSDRKSRQMLRRAHHQNPAAIVIACGCYAQTSAKEIAKIEGVTLILGTNERHRILEAVEAYRQDGERRIYLPSDEDLFQFEAMPHTTHRTMSRAYVKIQEGCNQFCAYCIIPYARGPLRSRSVADTIAEIRALSRAGYREVILTGIHIGAYGKGHQDEGTDLAGLCRAILDETDLPRLRLGSIECTEITPELLELLAQETRLVRHLHVPLQAGSDQTLKEMRRPYRTEHFREQIRRLRQAVPKIAITTDLMVGFPGESEDAFRESLIFANDMAFSDMHIFKYSMRQGTPAAARADQIPAPVKDERAKKMAAIAQKNHRSYQESQLGETLSVLVERRLDDGRLEGHSDNYLVVRFAGEAEPGAILPVQIDGIEKEAVTGNLLADATQPDGFVV